MFKPSESEPLKPRALVVQMKVALQEVESSMENIDRATGDLMKAYRELSIRRDNLRALIREQECSCPGDPHGTNRRNRQAPGAES